MFKKEIIIENLKELKNVLIKIFLFFIFCTICNFFIVENFIDYFTKPLISIINQGGANLIYTNIVEPFAIRMRLAIIGSIFLSLPFIIWQIYSFVSPGLYKNEKKIVIPYLIASPILFTIGALFVYYFVFPNAWNFFLKFAFVKHAAVDIKMMIVISDYLNLCISMMMLFGLAFQLPLILNLLLQISLISIENLIKARKIVIVLIFIVAAILTPPDILSQILLAIPLFLLYESSILFGKFLKKQKNKIQV